MDIVIKTIIGIKITNNLSDNNGYYNQNDLCVITPNVLYITMDIVIKDHGMRTKHSDVLRVTMDIVIKTIIEDKINNLVITISK